MSTAACQIHTHIYSCNAYTYACPALYSPPSSWVSLPVVGGMALPVLTIHHQTARWMFQGHKKGTSNSVFSLSVCAFLSHQVSVSVCNGLCEYMCVPWTMHCQGLQGLPTRIDRHWHWLPSVYMSNVFSLVGTHTHTHTECLCLRKARWVGMVEISVSSHLRSFCGCYASACVPFLESAWLHLHTLKHAPAHLSAVSYTCSMIIGMAISPSVLLLLILKDPFLL